MPWGMPLALQGCARSGGPELAMARASTQGVFSALLCLVLWLPCALLSHVPLTHCCFFRQGLPQQGLLWQGGTARPGLCGAEDGTQLPAC